MLNQVILVGRLVNEVKDEKAIIAVNRNFKNEDGIYETDFFNITFWGSISQNMVEYCKSGDLIGVKGRLQSSKNEDGKYITNIIAEKVTFLSSKKPDDVKED